MSSQDATPTVSVVIPTYNRARDLERALRSIAGQTLMEWEVIIVDQHSTDGTDDMIARFGDSRIKLLKTGREGSIAASRNLGIARARAPFVAFLDSDDWWAPRKLEVSVQALERGADVVYHDLFLVRGQQRDPLRRRVRSWTIKPPAMLDLLENGNAIPLSSAVVRRTVLMSSDGMPEDRSLMAMEDYECWINVARVTERFVRIRGTLGYYWAGGGNTSNDARTLRLLDLFEARHGDVLERGGRPRRAWWAAYARGRIHLRSRSYDAARSELARISLRSVPPSFALRTMALRLAAQIGRLTGRSAPGSAT